VSEHLEAELLDEYALGTLDASTSARVAAHLRECSACSAEFADLRAVLDVLPHALDEKPADAALLDRIVAQTRTAPIAPKLSPRIEAAWFSSPLVGALAAGLVLALASDAWLALREFQKIPQTVAIATPAAATPAATTPAPTTSAGTTLFAATPSPATPAPAATAARTTIAPSPTKPATPATAPSASPSAAAQDPAMRREIARLERALAAEKAAASANDARSRADIQRLEQTLASTRTAVRIVYVKPPPAPVPTPLLAPSPLATAAAAAPELVAALRTGRVFAVDGTVGKETWHLTIVQPADGAKAEIFSGTPHAPDGQTYRTWVVRSGKTYDAGPLPPGEPTTLVMPMALQSGDVVAFSREPVGTGDHPTQPFLMKVTIAE
jgi:hypothetical protein